MSTNDPFDFAGLTGSNSIDNLIEESNISRGATLQNKFREKQNKILQDKTRHERMAAIQNGTATFEPTLGERQEAAALGLNVMRDVNGVWGAYPERPEIIAQDLNAYTTELEQRFLNGNIVEPQRNDPLTLRENRVDREDQTMGGSVQDGVANIAEIGALALSPQTAVALWNAPSMGFNKLANKFNSLIGNEDAPVDPIRLTRLDDFKDPDSNAFGHMMYTAQKELEASASSLHDMIAEDPNLVRKEHNEVAQEAYQTALQENDGDILKSILGAVGAVIKERPDAALQIAAESLPTMLASIFPPATAAYVAGAYTQNFAEMRDQLTATKGELNNEDINNMTLASLTSAALDMLGDRAVAGRAFDLGKGVDLTKTLSQELVMLGARTGQAALGEAIAEGGSELIKEAAKQDKFGDGSFLTDEELLTQAGESAVMGILGSVGATAPATAKNAADVVTSAVKGQQNLKKRGAFTSSTDNIDLKDEFIQEYDKHTEGFGEDAKQYKSLRDKVDDIKSQEEYDSHLKEMLTTYGRMSAKAYLSDFNEQSKEVADKNTDLRFNTVSELVKRMKQANPTFADANELDAANFYYDQVEAAEAEFKKGNMTGIPKEGTEAVAENTEAVEDTESAEPIAVPDKEEVAEADLDDDNQEPDIVRDLFEDGSETEEPVSASSRLRAKNEGQELDKEVAQEFSRPSKDARVKEAQVEAAQVFGNIETKVTDNTAPTPDENGDLQAKGTAKPKYTPKEPEKLSDNALRANMRTEYANALVFKKEAEIAKSPELLQKLTKSLASKARSKELRGTDVGAAFANLSQQVSESYRAVAAERKGKTEPVGNVTGTLRKNISDFDQRMNGKVIQNSASGTQADTTNTADKTNLDDLYFNNIYADREPMTPKEIRTAARKDAAAAVRSLGISMGDLKARKLNTMQVRQIESAIRDVQTHAQNLFAEFDGEGNSEAVTKGTENLTKYVDQLSGYVADSSTSFMAEGSPKANRKESLITGFNPKAGKLKVTRNDDGTKTVESDAGRWFSTKGITKIVNQAKNKFRDSVKSNYTPDVVDTTAENLGSMVSGFSSTLRTRMSDILPKATRNGTLNTNGVTTFGQTHEIREMLTYAGADNKNLDLDENIVAALATATYSALDGLRLRSDDRALGKIFGMDFDSSKLMPNMFKAVREYRDGRVNRTYLADAIGRAALQSLGVTFDKDAAPNGFRDNLATSLGLVGLAVMEEQGLIENVAVNAKEFGKLKASLNYLVDENSTSTPEASVNFVRVVGKEGKREEVADEVASIVEKLTVVNADGKKLYTVSQIMGTPTKLRGLSTTPFSPEEIRESVQAGLNLPVEAVESAQAAMPTKYVLNQGLVNFLRANDDVAVVNLIGEFAKPITDLSEEGLQAWADQNFHKNVRANKIYEVEGMLESVKRAREALELLEGEGWKDGDPVYFNFAIFQQTRFGIDSNTLNPQTDKFHRALVTPYTTKGREMKGENIRKDVEAEMPTSIQGLAYAFGSFDEKSDDSVRTQAVETMRSFLRNESFPAVEAFVSNYEKTGKIDTGLLNEANEELQATENVFGAKVKAKGLSGALALQDLVNYRKALKDPEYTFTSNQVIEVDGLTNGFAITTMQAPITAYSADDLANTGSYSNPEMTVGKHFSTKGVNDSYENIVSLMNKHLPNAIKNTIGKALATFRKKDMPHKYARMIDVTVVEGALQGAYPNVAFDDAMGSAALEAIETIQGDLVIDDVVTKEARNMVKHPFMIINYAASLATVKRSVKAAFVRQLDDRFASFNEITNMTERAEAVQEFALSLNGIGIQIDAQALTSNPLEYELDNESKRIVEDVLGEAVGQAMIQGIDDRLGDLNRYRKMLNNTIHLQFEVFDKARTEYSKQKGFKQNAAGRYEMTHAEADKMIEELKPLLPGFKGAYKDSGESNFIPLFNLEKFPNTNDDSNKVSVDFGFTGRKENTITARSATKDFSPLGVGGAAAMTQALDAYTMLMTAKAFPDVLHVHDAVKVTAEQAPEVAEYLNKVFVESNIEYSMMDDAIKSLFDRLKLADSKGLMNFELQHTAELTEAEKRQLAEYNRIAKQKDPKAKPKTRPARVARYSELPLGTVFQELISNRIKRDTRAEADYSFYTPAFAEEEVSTWAVENDDAFIHLDEGTKAALKKAGASAKYADAFQGVLFLQEMVDLKSHIDVSREVKLRRLVTSGQYTSPIVDASRNGQFTKLEGFRPILRKITDISDIDATFLEMLETSHIVRESSLRQEPTAVDRAAITDKQKEVLQEELHGMVNRINDIRIANRVTTVVDAELAGTFKPKQLSLEGMGASFTERKSPTYQPDLLNRPDPDMSTDAILDAMTDGAVHKIVDEASLRKVSALVSALDTKTSPKHKERLDNVVATILGAGLASLGEIAATIGKRTGTNFGLNRGDAVYVLSGSESATLDQGEYEILVHELVHSIGRLIGTKGYTRFHNRINQIKKDVMNAVGSDEALSDLFIPADADKTDPEIRAEADRLRDYVFYNSSKADGTATTRSTQEFITYALTNPAFIENLNNYTTQQKRGRPLMEGESVAARLLNVIWDLFQSIVDRVMNEREGHNEKAVDQAVYDVMMDMTAAMQRSARKSRFDLLKRFERTVFEKAEQGNKYAAKGIGKAIDVTRNSVSKMLKSNGGQFELSQKAQDTLMKALLAKEYVTGEEVTAARSRVQQIAFESNSSLEFINAMREEFGTGSESTLTGILHSIVQEGGQLEGYFKAHRKFKFEVERASAVEEEAIGAKVAESFGKKLDDAESFAVTDFILRTDFASVADHYGNLDGALHNLLTDEAFVKTEMTSMMDEVLDGLNPQVANAVRFQMEALAKHMVDNQNHMGNQIRNVDNLVKGAAFTFEEGSENRDNNAFVGMYRKQMEKFNSDTARSAMEAWVSLRAFELMDTSDKKKFTKLVNEEYSRTDGNGIRSVIEMQQAFKEMSKDMTFNSSEFLMIKGYTPSLYDHGHDFQLGSVADRERMAREGYELANKDTKNLRSKDSALYVRRGMTGSEMVSGPLNSVLLHSRGTDLFDMVDELGTTTDMATLRERMGIRNRNYSRDLIALAKKGGTAMHISDRGIPVFNNEGYITSLQYTMSEKRQQTVLKKRKNVDDVLGRAYGSVIRRHNAPILSEAAFDAIHEDYLAEYNNNPDGFVWVNGNDLNEFGVPNQYKDEFRKMPEALQTRAAIVYGGRGIPVRKGMVRTMFGGRKMSATNSSPVKYLQAKYPNKPVTFWVGAVENMWKEVVQVAKLGIVIKTPAVFMFNVLSNFALTSMRGVPISDSIKWHVEAIREVGKYKELESREAVLRTEIISSNPTKAKRAQAELDDVINEMENSPLRKLFQEGVYQAITEDISLDKRGYLDSAKNWVASRTGLRSTKAELVLDYMFMNSNTMPFKLMNRATQMSDFASRYAMYRHETRKNEALPARERRKEDTIINEIMEDFVNYDLPDPKGLEYANAMGGVMFTKYFFGVQKVVQRLIRRNALTTSGVVSGQLILGDIEDTLDNSLIMKDWGQLFKTPADIIEAAVEPYGLNLVLK